MKVITIKDDKHEGGMLSLHYDRQDNQVSIHLDIQKDRIGYTDDIIVSSSDMEQLLAYLLDDHHADEMTLQTATHDGTLSLCCQHQTSCVTAIINIHRPNLNVTFHFTINHDQLSALEEEDDLFWDNEPILMEPQLRITQHLNETYHDTEYHLSYQDSHLTLRTTFTTYAAEQTSMAHALDTYTQTDNDTQLYVRNSDLLIDLLAHRQMRIWLANNDFPDTSSLDVKFPLTDSDLQALRVMADE